MTEVATDQAGGGRPQTGGEAPLLRDPGAGRPRTRFGTQLLRMVARPIACGVDAAGGGAGGGGGGGG